MGRPASSPGPLGRHSPRPGGSSVSSTFLTRRQGLSKPALTPENTSRRLELGVGAAVWVQAESFVWSSQRDWGGAWGQGRPCWGGRAPVSHHNACHYTDPSPHKGGSK